MVSKKDVLSAYKNFGNLGSDFQASLSRIHLVANWLSGMASEGANDQDLMDVADIFKKYLSSMEQGGRGKEHIGESSKHTTEFYLNLLQIYRFSSFQGIEGFGEVLNEFEYNSALENYWIEAVSEASSQNHRFTFDLSDALETVLIEDDKPGSDRRQFKNLFDSILRQLYT